MALFQQAGFDSYVVDGPSVFIQKMIGLFANPVSRLFGLKTYHGSIIVSGHNASVNADHVILSNDNVQEKIHVEEIMD